jgi:hypothetical protein
MKCGCVFEVTKSVIKKGGGKYCSKECTSRQVARICEFCGQEFYTFQSEVSRGGGKYCSKECGHQSKKNPVERICLYCGEKFFVTKSVVKDGRGKYCSQKCCDKDRTSIEFCLVCGKKFNVCRSVKKTGRGLFCSKKCLGISLRNKVEVSCRQCNKLFSVKPSVTKKGSGKFCSKDCHDAWRSENIRGENSPGWKGGGISYYGQDWRSQRNKARKRDGYKCRNCGITEKKNGRQMDVHHIIPFREFNYIPGENKNYKDANKLRNLISLCHSCHLLAEFGSIPVQPALL